MSDEPAHEKQDLASDLFGSKSEISKIFKTFVQVIKNVKVVADDYYYNKGEFSRPVKYTLAVIAPYIIIIQLFDIDMAQHLMEAGNAMSDTAKMTAEDPEMAGIFKRYNEISLIFNKIQFDFLPVFYALLYVPIMAFWLKKLFKNKELKFSYYYGLTSYMMMTSTAVTMIFLLLSIYGLYSISTYMLIAMTLSISFYSYCIIKAFNAPVIKGFIKSVLVVALMFITVIIPMTIIITTITFLTM